MDQIPPAPKPMVTASSDVDDDFETAKRVARRLFEFNDNALSFCASSDESKRLFIAWVKTQLRSVSV